MVFGSSQEIGENAAGIASKKVLLHAVREGKVIYINFVNNV